MSGQRERCEAWSECGNTGCDYYNEHNALLTGTCKPCLCVDVGRVVKCVPVEPPAPEPQNVDDLPPFYGVYPGVVGPGQDEQAIDLGDIGEFKPVDLGLIREQLSGHVIALVSTDMISAMCDEIEWLRGCHNQSSAEALVLSLRNGRLRDDVAALVAERDELRQTIASNRAAFLQMVDEVTK